MIYLYMYITYVCVFNVLCYYFQLVRLLKEKPKFSSHEKDHFQLEDWTATFFYTSKNNHQILNSPIKLYAE